MNNIHKSSKENKRRSNSLNKRSKQSHNKRFGDFDDDLKELARMLENEDPDYVSEDEEVEESDADKRCIYISDEITKETFQYVYNIIEINKDDDGIPIEDREPIKVFIDTPGGDLDVAQAISDVIRLSKTPIKVIGIGNVYSAGAYILTTSPPGTRYIFPNATMLIHDGYFQLGETSAAKGIALYGNIKKQYDRLLDKFAGACSVDKETIRTKAKQEWYLTPEETLEMNMADYIVDSIDILF